MTEQEALDLVAACKAAYPSFNWGAHEVRANGQGWYRGQMTWIVQGEGPGDDMWWVEIETYDEKYVANTARGGALNQVREGHGGWHNGA